MSLYKPKNKIYFSKSTSYHNHNAQMHNLFYIYSTFNIIVNTNILVKTKQNFFRKFCKNMNCYNHKTKKDICSNCKLFNTHVKVGPVYYINEDYTSGGHVPQYIKVLRKNNKNIFCKCASNDTSKQTTSQSK